MVIFQYNPYIFGIHLRTVLYPKPCYNEPCYKEVEEYIVAVLTKGELDIAKRPLGGHIIWQTVIIFRETHQGTEKNLSAKFQQNSSAGYRGDTITG